MTKVTNTGAGPRTVNVWKGNNSTNHTISPGESADVELHDPDHPALAGMVATGQVAFNLEEARSAKKDRDAKAKEEADRKEVLARSASVTAEQTTEIAAKDARIDALQKQADENQATQAAMQAQLDDLTARLSKKNS